jgi:hypothetical protein
LKRQEFNDDRRGPFALIPKIVDEVALITKIVDEERLRRDDNKIGLYKSNVGQWGGAVAGAAPLKATHRDQH